MKPPTTRDQFLARIRAATATHAHSAPAPAVAPSEHLARLVPASTAPADLERLFRDRATAAGIRIIDASDNWPAALTRELAARWITSATLAISDDALRDHATAALRAASITTLAPAPDNQFAAAAGITDAHAAIAETGSLVLISSPRSARLAHLVPPLHIALLRRTQILPDLLDLQLPSPAPAALTIISGPSKTADIEGILITGVHGPAELVVLLV